MKKYEVENPGVPVPNSRYKILNKNEFAIKLQYKLIELQLITRNIYSFRYTYFRSEGKPRKPPTSGYNLFCKKNLCNKKFKKLETQEKMMEVAKMWKETSEAEKKALDDKVLKVNFVNLHLIARHF